MRRSGFLTTRIFPELWEGGERVFLVVAAEHKGEVRERLPGNSIWVFAETGGKTVYVNQPPEPGQPPLAQLDEKLKLTAEP